MDQHHTFLEVTEETLGPSDVSTYRRLVGRLIYLTIIRSDISCSVNILAQFFASPKEAHLHPAFKLVKYLKQSHGQGFLFSVNNFLSLTAFCDADLGGAIYCPDSL